MREKLTKRNEQTGFTIIEVVLVLAIAGLIFLIVFLALPQLQASRRDTQRKNDTGRLLAALETYAGSNQGDYPEGSADYDNFVNNYLEGEFNDPSTGDPYTDNIVEEIGDPGASSNPKNPDNGPGYTYYRTEAECDGDQSVALAGETRRVAVVMSLENGTYCQDNQ